MTEHILKHKHMKKRNISHFSFTILFSTHHVGLELYRVFARFQTLLPSREYVVIVTTQLQCCVEQFHLTIPHNTQHTQTHTNNFVSKKTKITNLTTKNKHTNKQHKQTSNQPNTQINKQQTNRQQQQTHKHQTNKQTTNKHTTMSRNQPNKTHKQTISSKQTNTRTIYKQRQHNTTHHCSRTHSTMAPTKGRGGGGGGWQWTFNLLHVSKHHKTNTPQPNTQHTQQTLQVIAHAQTNK